MSVRVLHVLESLDPDAGSIAVCLGGLHEALTARGLRSSSIASPGDAVRILGDADLVHIHGWGYERADQLAAAALKARRPYIVSPHGALTSGLYNRPTWKERLRCLWRGRKLVRGAACITALHALEEHDLRAWRIHPQIRVLPYGLSFGEYDGSPTADRVPPSVNRSLLMLGDLHPRGGCVALLKAVAEIGPDANGWTVVLAGKDRGGWRRMLEAAVRRKKGDDRVVFAEAPTIAEQRARLASASVFAAPDLHIGPSVSIMQAVAMGVPVIASTCVAPPGLEGAIRVCGPNREELRGALRSVLTLSDESRRDMGEKARTIGSAVFDWSVLAEQ